MSCIIRRSLMKRGRIIVSALAGLLGVVDASAAELFRSSFESPPVGPSYSAIFAGNGIDGWTVETGTIEVVGTYWAAAEGNQSIDLSGIFEAAGTIYRDVATTPGNWYKLKFAFAGNPLDGAV